MGARELHFVCYLIQVLYSGVFSSCDFSALRKKKSSTYIGIHPWLFLIRMTGPTDVDSTSAKIEKISINDRIEEPTEPLVPHDRQIVDDVISIWKSDPSTESLGVAILHQLVKQRHMNWDVSKDRVRDLLKHFGLLVVDEVDEQYTYANDIKSEETPDIELPENVKIKMTPKKGKGLFAKKNIKKGDMLWEETQLFFVPPLANVELMKAGKACSYCGKLLSESSRSSVGKSVLRGLDCNVCSEMWCSHACKKTDAQLHGLLKHNVYNPHAKTGKKIIDASSFLELQDYCLKEQWNALYAVTIIYACILNDKTDIKGRQFRAMARVSQKIRYKALNSSAGAFDSLQGGALFVEEQQETLWQEGYKLFSKVFPKASESGHLSFDEFMHMMGTYNINNVDNCIFLTQSHLNHNCKPNTDVDISPIRTQGLLVFASRDIKSGEELTTSYVNPSHTVQQRQRELRVNWGFKCVCSKCKEDLKKQQRRKSSSPKSVNEGADIRNMIANVKKEIGEDGIELEIPLDYNGERRKSVRFDETVIQVGE